MKRQQKWNLERGVAQLNWPSFALQIETSTPELGGKVDFSPASADSGADGALFQIEAATKVDAGETVETYCRGRDLISRYRAGSDDPISREIYWRLVEASELQTDLLDSAPQPSVPSIFSNASNRWFQATDNTDNDTQWSEQAWDDACFAAGEGGRRVACLIGFPSGNKLLQTVYPPDLRGVEINVTEEQTEVHWQLRSDFLEKGVIRRLRLLTVVGGEDSSDQDLLDAAQEFYRSELPLTV